MTFDLQPLSLTAAIQRARRIVSGIFDATGVERGCQYALGGRATIGSVWTKGIAGSQIVILDALLKLRQACCDPRLTKTPAARAGRAPRSSPRKTSAPSSRPSARRFERGAALK